MSAIHGEIAKNQLTESSVNHLHVPRNALMSMLTEKPEAIYLLYWNGLNHEPL